MKSTKIFATGLIPVVIIFLILNCNLSFAKVSDDTTKTKKEMKHDMHKHMDMKMNTKEHQTKDTTSIIRQGTIDLKAIDANKDGKVYQDQMDWNVISDKPGKCPLCKMTLEEVTLKQAKENLKKNNFKVK